MHSLRKLSGLLLAAALVAPTLSMAQDRDDHRDEHRAAAMHDAHERGAGPDHNWHRGDRIPDSYRDKHHEVDWRSHHLRQPPAGYHWVDVDGDFVLAAVATGVIADMLINH
jgi:Ni/Co efflux regulator RcnB